MEYKRSLVQLCASILYNSNFFLSKPIRSSNVCVPGLNCAYCPGAISGCPLGTLQNTFGSGFTRIPFYAIASIILFSLLLGRIICGWLCPFGFLQDLLYKLPTPKLKKSIWTKRLSYLKYAFFVAFIVLIPLYYYYVVNSSLPPFCEWLCPNGLLSAFIMLIFDVGFGYALISDFKIIFALITVGGAIFAYRSFCRFICPLGAWYSAFSKLSVFAIKVDLQKCIGCDKCVRECLLDCTHVGDRECIACGKCRHSCPTNAISYGVRYPNP